MPHGEIPPRPHCRLSLVLGAPLRPPAWQECRRSVTVIECYEEGRGRNDEKEGRGVGG